MHLLAGMVRVARVLSAALLALVSVARGGELPLAERVTPAQRDWDLVRSVSNPYGGPTDLVLIPQAKQRDVDYYSEIAKAVCGIKTTCSVMFWVDRKHIPMTGDMPVVDLQVMTATYERHPSYRAPVLRLACWLYPSKAVGEKAKCFYMPGGVMPWEK